MKYLLILVVIALVLWLARSGRRAERVRTADAKRERVPQREDMVACAQCGVHLPASEALPGRGGVFCGEPHRLAYEQAHPPT